jgi:hypothetical protein
MRVFKDLMDRSSALLDKSKVSPFDVTKGLISAIPFEGERFAKDFDKSTMPIPTGFGLLPKVSPQGIDTSEMGMQSVRVPTKEALNELKWSDLVGTAGASRMFEALGQNRTPELFDTLDATMLGLGGLSAARAVPKVAKAVGEGAKTVGMGGLEMIDRGMFGEGPLRNFVPQHKFVVKPKGGNWFDDTLNRSVQDLKKTDRGIPFSDEDVTYLESEIERLRNGNLQNEMVQENIRRLQGDLAMNKQESALNNWLDNTFKNYVKNEMATPEDRVRKMFDRRTEDVEKLEAKYEKDITKLETKLANAKAQPQSRERDQAIAYLERDIENKIQDLNFDVDTASKTIGHIRDLESEARYPQHGVISVREDRGFPTEGLATSTIGKGWENLTDSLLGMKKAGRIGRLPETEERYPWLESVDPEAMVYKTLSGLTRDTGIDHVLDVLRQDVRSGAITPEQLSKITMDQAVERTANFDRAAAVKMRKTAIQNTEGFPTFKEYPAGYKWIELAPPKELPAGYKVIQSDIGEGFKVVDADGNDAVPTASRPTNNMGHTNIPFHKTEEEAITDALKYDKRLEKALKYEGDTMGHCVGGYCPDVQEGRTRIFSLRDRRGEPHVTVEVQPKPIDSWKKLKEVVGPEKGEQLFEEFSQLPDIDAGNAIAKFQEFILSKGIKSPEIINQIKGKQNLRPIEKYDPYTQDFVKSGVFSDVRDLENTGLYKADPNELGMYLPKAEDIRDLPVKRSDLFSRAQQAGLFPEGQKYLNRNEWEDILRRQYQAENPPKPDVPPDLEGMKRGGKVSISNNPDTMMMELGNQKFGIGGLAKVTKAAKNIAEPMKASEALGKIEGRPLKITQSDRTKVGGGYLGGPGFSSLQLTEPEYRAAEAAWGVQNAGTAKTILGGGKKGDNAVYAAMIGTPTQHQSNQMVFDKLYGDFKKAAKRGELTPELRDLINTRLAASVDKKGNPVFPADVDIMDKNFRNIADTFSRRSIAGHLMGGVQVGGKKGQIIDYDKIIRNTTDPALLDLPTGALGNRLFTLSGGIVDRPDLHPAFPAILQGEDLGLTFTPVERNLVMKDFVDKTMREKKRMPGYMDYTRGNPPTQLITEDILTELQKLGLKKGGAVKQPAAYIDGSEFVEAAQKYGIKDSMSNLNMIVNLVNKGLSVDDAARQVSDSGMHKAAGGAITGDDLILEERPL